MDTTPTTDLPLFITQYVSKLVQTDAFDAIFLTGSHTRGDATPQSDIDLVIIHPCSFHISYEDFGGHTFELIHTSKTDASQFYQENPHDCAEFWQHCITLYNPRGIVEQLEREAKVIIASGPPAMSPWKKEHLIRDLTVQLQSIIRMKERDPHNANLQFGTWVARLLEGYFTTHQLFRPSPKRQLSVLQRHAPTLWNHFIENLQLHFNDRIAHGEKLYTAWRNTL